MITFLAGYHRLWSHRSYIASYPLQVFLILAGASAVQGSCYWWARRHRSHHRHTDTDLDPYNSERGLLWTHIGWIIFDTDLRPGPTDISDLKNDPLVQWQHRWYFAILTIVGYILPMCIPGLLYGDWRGGFYFVGALRLTACHHVCWHPPCTDDCPDFCYRAHFASIPLRTILEAHHMMTNIPLATISSLLSSRWGKGIITFIISFPWITGTQSCYVFRNSLTRFSLPAFRNAFRWWQYDPTKWFIATCHLLGLASHLRVFPSNEIEKSALTMKLKALKGVQDSIVWPVPPEELPIVTWESCMYRSPHAYCTLTGHRSSTRVKITHAIACVGFHT